MRTKYLVQQTKAKLFKLFKDLAKSGLNFTQMHKYKKKMSDTGYFSMHEIEIFMDMAAKYSRR